MELVSILMTIYNGAHIIDESMNAILNQTYNNIEIVIVNDGSTDKTSEIVNNYKERDSRIIFIDRKENKGRSYSLNEGLSACAGRYVAINDADDISEIDRIEVMLKFIEDNNIANLFGVVGSSHVEENRLVGTTEKYHLKRGTFGNKVSNARMFLGMPFIHSSFIYNKNALMEVGGFASDVSASIDYFTLIKIAKKYPIYACSKVTVKRVVDGRNYFLKKDVLANKEKNQLVIDLWQRRNMDNYQIYKIIKLLNELKKRFI